MATIRDEATYNEKTGVTEYVGNPLIAALPSFTTQDDLLKALLKLPPIRNQDRTTDSVNRLERLSIIQYVHIPHNHDLFIARSLSRCIHAGYLGRNPMPFSLTAQVMKEYQIEVTYDLENFLLRTAFLCFGFSVLGISGTGKTCSVLNALMCYPQVIEHTEYHGQPFHCTQLVWLKVDCPGDASPKGLCTSILTQLDAALGTHYSNEVNSRVSKDYLTNRVSQCLRAHHLGVLVIDDIQNLCGTKAKKDTSTDLLSFLIYLMETLAIPVVMVGTPKVLTLFQEEFQMAKRATGDGTVRMGLMEKDSSEWKRYITKIWKYQFLENVVPLTSEMNDVFYNESVGNPFLCSLLYKLVQDDAITSRSESFTVSDVQKVAKEKLCITANMRANMLSGKDEELKKYEFLWEAVGMDLDMDRNDTKRKKSAGQNDAEKELTNLIVQDLVKSYQISIDQATKYAHDAIAAKGCAEPQETMGYAVALVKTAESNRSDKTNHEVVQ